MKNWPSFEQLIRMAETDPEGLEKFRLREVGNLIENSSEAYRRRLRGLQFEIDCQREIHKTPMGACIAISKMMQDSLLHLNYTLNGDKKVHGADGEQGSYGQVIPFPANF